MKTFTLRLTDTEAKMLDRLSLIYGKSKNSVITSILADKYSSIDENAQIIDGEILDLSNDIYFGLSVYETLFINRKTENISGKDFLACKRALEYSLDLCSEEGYELANNIEDKLKDLYELLDAERVIS